MMKLSYQMVSLFLRLDLTWNNLMRRTPEMNWALRRAEGH